MRKVIIGTGSAEITEKKSRFIATAAQVKSEAEAVAFIEKQKKQYWDARHNCYAYVAGANADLQRFSDDGEPSGTAGMPILDVLNGNELTNTVVVVTRYFGGVLLGTGGLVRAYSGVTAKVIEQLGSKAQGTEDGFIAALFEGSKVTFTCEYKDIGRMENLVSEMDIPVFEKEYAEVVKVTIALTADSDDIFRKAAMNATGGGIRFEDPESICFYKAGSSAVIYDFG